MEKTAVTCVSWLPRGTCTGRLTGAQQEEACQCSAVLQQPLNPKP